MSLIGAPPSAIWLLVFGSLVALAAWWLRPVVVPGWSGAGARLIEVVLAISLAVVLAEVLGLAGLLRGAWLIAGAGALAILDGGAMDFDSLWYHLPLAAGFARSGSVTAIQHLDPVTLARFYPADSE